MQIRKPILTTQDLCSAEYHDARHAMKQLVAMINEVVIADNNIPKTNRPLDMGQEELAIQLLSPQMSALQCGLFFNPAERGANRALSATLFGGGVLVGGEACIYGGVAAGPAVVVIVLGSLLFSWLFRKKITKPSWQQYINSLEQAYQYVDGDPALGITILEKLFGLNNTWVGTVISRALRWPEVTADQFAYGHYLLGKLYANKNMGTESFQQYELAYKDAKHKALKGLILLEMNAILMRGVEIRVNGSCLSEQDKKNLAKEKRVLFASSYKDVLRAYLYKTTSLALPLRALKKKDSMNTTIMRQEMVGLEQINTLDYLTCLVEKGPLYEIGFAFLQSLIVVMKLSYLRVQESYSISNCDKKSSAIKVLASALIVKWQRCLALMSAGDELPIYTAIRDYIYCFCDGRRWDIVFVENKQFQQILADIPEASIDHAVAQKLKILAVPSERGRLSSLQYVLRCIQYADEIARTKFNHDKSWLDVLASTRAPDYLRRLYEKTVRHLIFKTNLAVWHRAQDGRTPLTRIPANRRDRLMPLFDQHNHLVTGFFGVDGLIKEMEKFYNGILANPMRINHGLILSGPGGVGKTVLMKILAQRAGYALHDNRMPYLSNAPACVMIENIDKSKISEHELDAMQNKKYVFVGTTNNYAAVDKRFRSRSMVLHFSLPDEATRNNLLSYHLRKSVFANANSRIAELAKKTDGFSARELVSLAERIVGAACVKTTDEFNVVFSRLLKDLTFCDHARGADDDNSPIKNEQLLSQFFGLDYEIQKINEFYQAILNNPREDIHCLIVSGPSGTGKTELCKQLAKKIGYRISPYQRAASDDRYLGQRHFRVQAWFDDAMSANEPICLFIDEIDDVLTEFQNDPVDANHHDARKNLNIFKEKISLLQGKRIVLVGTTNHYENMNRVIQSRAFHLAFTLPNKETRIQILNYALRDVEQDEDCLKRGMIEATAEATTGFSPRVLIGFADKLCRLKRIVNTKDFYDAFEDARADIASCYSKLATVVAPRLHRHSDDSERSLSGTSKEITRAFNKMLHVVTHPKFYLENNLGGLNWLLYGPPGTGKTKFARDIAESANVMFFSVPVNATIPQLKKIFSSAKHLEKSIIFINGIEKLSHFGNADGVLLTELDGFVKSKNTFFVIAATNHPEQLSNALRSRFRHINIPLPNEYERCMQFKHEFNNLNPMLIQVIHEHDNSNKLCAELAARTEGFSRRDIASFIKNMVYDLPAECQQLPLQPAYIVSQLATHDLQARQEAAPVAMRFRR